VNRNRLFRVDKEEQLSARALGGREQARGNTGADHRGAPSPQHEIVGRSSKFLLIILITILITATASRILILATLGPIVFGDTDTHFDAVDVLNRIGFGTGTFNWATDYPSSFRVLGYAALMWVANRILGFHYGAMTPNFLLLVSCQVMLSVVAAGFLFHTALKVSGGSVLIATLVILIHLFSLELVYDVALLPGSPFDALMLIVVCRVIDSMLAAKPPKITESFVLGIVLGAMLMLRETALFLTPAIAALLGAATMLHAKFARAVIVCLMVCLPVAAGYVGYSAWNLSRTGSWFLSTGGQVAMMVPAMRIAEHAPDVRKLWDARLLQADEGQGTVFERSQNMVAAMIKRHRMTPLVASEITSQAAMRSIATNPLIFAYETFKQFTTWPVVTIISLPAALDGLLAQRPGIVKKQVVPKYGTPVYLLFIYYEATEPWEYLKLSAQLRENLLLLGLRVLAMIVSAILFIAFVVGGIVSVVRLAMGGKSHSFDRNQFCAASIMLLYVYWSLLHCALSFEVRYVLVMQSIAAMYGLTWIAWFFRGMRPTNVAREKLLTR